MENGEIASVIYEQRGTPVSYTHLDVYKRQGYDFSPEGEEFLPAGEKEELSQEGRTAISNIARQYLLIRYNIPVDASFVDTQWAFYSQYAAPDFLERDGISRESLETLLEEWQDQMCIRDRSGGFH